MVYFLVSNFPFEKNLSLPTFFSFDEMIIIIPIILNIYIYFIFSLIFVDYSNFRTGEGIHLFLNLKDGDNIVGYSI